MPLYNPQTGSNYALSVRDEKPNGTSGGTSLTGANIRVLNTIQSNTIPGASLSSDQVTLPAGVYSISGGAPAFNCSRMKVYLYNVTDAAITLVGNSTYSAGTNTSIPSEISGQITITSTKVFELRQYIETGVSTNGLGIETSAGMVEVYAVLQFIKVG